MPERAFWGLLPIFMESEIACTPFIVWFLTCFMPSVLRFHIMGYWHSRLDFVSKLIWNCPPSSKLIDSNMKCGLCGFIFTPTLCALFLFSIFPCFWYLFMECIIILISARGNKELQRKYLQWWMGYMLLYENCRQESVFSERGSWGYREEIFWEEGLRSRWGEKKFDPLHSGSSAMISIYVWSISCLSHSVFFCSYMRSSIVSVSPFIFLCFLACNEGCIYYFWRGFFIMIWGIVEFCIGWLGLFPLRLFYGFFGKWVLLTENHSSWVFEGEWSSLS